MPDAQSWIQEGIATYVEPIARVQTGQLSAEKVWGDLIKGLPQGLPKKGDRGLDHTPTWGRTYWGGALFCLLADIEIHQRTANRKGLQDALRAIANAGGTIETKSSLAYAFEIGDNATGVPVLSELYERMKAVPVNTNLHELWQQLGIEVRNGGVTFHEDAPLATVRRAIMKG
jgi:predicted metalloprotease with PDZ domain